MSFQIHALPATRFKPLFDLSDSELANMQANRMVADAKPGFPCRISLADAELGEVVILVNFEHQPADSPFRSSHAIFVREQAEQAFPAVGEVPDALTSRLISLRAFDKKHFMIAAEVVEGVLLSEVIPAMFDNPAVSYVHLHHAKQGCYAARVTRA